MAGSKRSRSLSSSGASSSPSDAYRSPKRQHRSRSRSKDRYRHNRDSRDIRNSRYEEDRAYHRSHRHSQPRDRSPDRRHTEPFDRSAGSRYRSQYSARPDPHASLSDAPPELYSVHRYQYTQLRLIALLLYLTQQTLLDLAKYHCRAKVQSVRPFGVFVALKGYRRHGMVHSSQVSADISFSREDEDEMKVKTMDFYASPGSDVINQTNGAAIAPSGKLRRVHCHVQVWVKVTEIREEGNGNFKLACSMKVCHWHTWSWSDIEHLYPTCSQLTTQHVGRQRVCYTCSALSWSVLHVQLLMHITSVAVITTSDSFICRYTRCQDNLGNSRPSIA